ncbi:MAG: histidine kinase [Bacteroidota bacterium]|nr:histidine kinase [Bacteroidota bacterium]
MRKQLQLFIFFLITSFSFAQNADGLVARYYFNNADVSNDVGPLAPPHDISFGEDRFGNSRSACILHGTDRSYLNLGTSSVLKPAEGTISIWVKITAENYSGRGVLWNPIVLTKNGPGDDFIEAYCILYGLKQKTLGVSSSFSYENQISICANNTLLLGQWYHIVMTYTDTSLCLYLNGELEDCAAKNFRTKFLATDSVMIGNAASIKNNRFFNGHVDDVSIYNRALSPDEIRDLYNESNPNKTHTILKYIFLFILSIISIYLIVTMVNRKIKRELIREKEQNRLQREKNRLQSQMYEMEMRVIKAQMNPHFIFNSMNSIQQFILAKDTSNANIYLVKFSKLLRKILESNTDEHISLENEVDILSKYIELEALRFKYAFNYEINTDAALMNSMIRIPQMLIQPFVENAIWHGLLPKKDNRKLTITFNRTGNDLLCCTIDDNGVGRVVAEVADSIPKKKSLGIHFIRQRLELMKKEWGGEYSIEIIDKMNDYGMSNGTRIIIKIPILNE